MFKSFCLTLSPLSDFKSDKCLSPFVDKPEYDCQAQSLTFYFYSQFL